jgi:spermidine synthase
MNKKEWQTQHLCQIGQQLEWLKNKPSGVLYTKAEKTQSLLVDKERDLIRLYFVDTRPTAKKSKSGIMSYINIQKPFDLQALYTQVMMLSLVWKNAPESIYVLGFGGGALSNTLHHYFPDALIENTEIDQHVINLSKRFFGISEGPSFKIFKEDGRAYLEKQPADKKYDIIFIDCYTGVGHTPYPLSTIEFFTTCREHLSEEGVICINILSTDPLFASKLRTLNRVFSNIYLFKKINITVLFASNGALMDHQTIRRKAEALQQEHGFEFPFVEHLTFLQAFNNPYPDAEILSDHSSQEIFLKSIAVDDPIFKNVGRNDFCPCGSGKKFKKCHGMKR